ncbi:hypothetical protein QD47_05540 [Paenibacillus terrae]|uniref:Uncharacterized protein n=1 Tax=Paenibacillus terrae TaxID=159743 RepID=A0A0D7X4Z0_9BACL|nr:hypothetical protein QD47_05540 [Paenibacillus terrae]
MRKILLLHSPDLMEWRKRNNAIITEFTNGRFFLTQYTTDRKDAPLSTWYSNGYKVYAWKMSTAKRSPND